MESFISLRETIENIAKANPEHFEKREIQAQHDEFDRTEIEFFEYWRPAAEWEMSLSNAAYALNKAIHQDHKNNVSWWQFDVQKGFHCKDDSIAQDGIVLLTSVQNMADTQRGQRFRYLLSWKGTGQPFDKRGILYGHLFFGLWDEEKTTQTQFINKDMKEVHVIREYKPIEGIEQLRQIAFDRQELAALLNKHGIKHTINTLECAVPPINTTDNRGGRRPKQFREALQHFCNTLVESGESELFELLQPGKINSFMIRLRRAIQNGTYHDEYVAARIDTIRHSGNGWCITLLDRKGVDQKPKTHADVSKFLNEWRKKNNTFA